VINFLVPWYHHHKVSKKKKKKEAGAQRVATIVQTIGSQKEKLSEAMVTVGMPGQ
jgi:hypothetical protein